MGLALFNEVCDKFTIPYSVKGPSIRPWGCKVVKFELGKHMVKCVTFVPFICQFIKNSPKRAIEQCSGCVDLATTEVSPINNYRRTLI